MKYLYSIIIPHRNIPHLLRRCLASIPARDDIQTIVVDDNSDSEYISGIQSVADEYPKAEFHYLRDTQGGGEERVITALQKP